jgi:GNAT superfamily N-acetyltransferase
VKIAFSMNDTIAAAYQRCFELAGPQFIHFVVKKGDTAVASASLYLHEEMAGFYNISVLPEFRKLGIGSALHNTRMNAAKEKGYTYATLQATPMAAHLGTNLGFQTHSEVNIYQRRR